MIFLVCGLILRLLKGLLWSEAGGITTALQWANTRLCRTKNRQRLTALLKRSGIAVAVLVGHEPL
jgi:hypothetical protein